MASLRLQLACEFDSPDSPDDYEYDDKFFINLRHRHGFHKERVVTVETKPELSARFNGNLSAFFPLEKANCSRTMALRQHPAFKDILDALEFRNYVGRSGDYQVLCRHPTLAIRHRVLPIPSPSQRGA